MDREKYNEQELPIKAELQVLFGNQKDTVIFEIGACEGEDSIKYAKLFPKGNVYSFEPLPNNVMLIKQNLSKHEISNVKVVDVALSDKKGTAKFHVSQGKPTGVGEVNWDFGNKSSSLLKPEKHLELTNFISFDQKISVVTDTIQSFCTDNNISRIDFIHMDAQGAELLILKGAKGFINNIKAIWLEVAEVELYKNQPLVGDIYKFMLDNNFVLIKNEIEGFAGDQLYISKSYYGNYKSLFPNGEWRKTTLLYKMILKAKILARRVVNKIFLPN